MKSQDRTGLANFHDLGNSAVVFGFLDWRAGEFKTALTSILVVDDFEPFRQFVCSMLREAWQPDVVCEATDGPEAVQQAERLRPSLILLDVGLPKLNGIEAARRIRKVSPESTILFLSQISDSDVVHEALSLGAQGYVLKSQVGANLRAAVEAVLRGERFVSEGLKHNAATAPENKNSKGTGYRQGFSPFPAKKGAITRWHEAHFYSDDEALLVGFASLSKLL
jgi:DNA-binding NarL/FixJ family response regulator